jgi:WD repeat-containing protein 81
LDLSGENSSGVAGSNLASDQCEQNPNLLSLLAAVESSTHYYLIYDYVENTMQDCLAYSPAILENQYNKILFIVYQLLSFMKFMHSKSLFLGDQFGLKDILIDKNLRLYILPKLDSNLIEYEEVEVEYKAPVAGINLRSVDYQNSLRDYCEMWCTGKLSNFDYLTILNNFAGRKTNSPYNHHIIPWVIDFTSRQGNFRDLTKSKYRLNKGDRQLDLTFSTCSTSSPHHVSDILSEITYYVYMARKTQKSVLCKHVRSKFVANEYPASIIRLVHLLKNLHSLLIS